jgi:hypothetical protein
MTGNFEVGTRGGKRQGRANGPASRRRFLEIEAMEERTLLAASPIRIGSLGDSLTDEYQFYAPYRTAAQNWPEILSALRPTQVSFGDFSTTTRGETRNQGYAQDWARSGATSTGDDIVNAGTTIINQYEGGDPAGAPGLLTQPGGLSSNVDVATILIGGNDYEQAVLNSLSYVITSGDVGSSVGEVAALQILGNLGGLPLNIFSGVAQAVQSIEMNTPNFPIVLITTPNVAFTPDAISLNNTLNNLIPSMPNILLTTLNNTASAITKSLTQLTTNPNVHLIDLDNLFSNFVANPVFDGTYIDPNVGGPYFNDLFVGDDFHPGTIGQAILANAIVGEIDQIFPGAITPLSDNEILAYAKSVQPVTSTVLTSSAGSATAGSPITFTTQVSSFPNINSTTTQENFSSVPPTGTIAYYDTATNTLLGVVPLVPQGTPGNYTGSTGTFTTTLGVGLHDVVAVYSGDYVYPAATTKTALEFVGTPRQVQLFSFMNLFQSNLSAQITQPQFQRWANRLAAGAPPQHVARSIFRYVYFHTKLPRNQKTALLERARQLKLIPNVAAPK